MRVVNLVIALFCLAIGLYHYSGDNILSILNIVGAVGNMALFLAPLKLEDV